jgi:cyclohexanecarboxylate-CoA ligase
MAAHRAAGEWPQKGLASLLVERAASTPEREFLVDGAQRLTFERFAARVGAMAGALADLGVGLGDVVSWELPSWWEAAALAVAVDHLGAISNPIIPIYREQEVSFIARQAGTRVLVVPGVFRSFDYRELGLAVQRQVPSLEHVLVVRDGALPGVASLSVMMTEGRSAGSIVERSADDVSMLFYTSGTTTEPKGVLHTTSTIGAFASLSVGVNQSGPDDVGLLQFPLTHIGGLAAFVIIPLMVGSRVVYLDQWEPERALRAIETEGVTSAGGPPVILQGLINASGFSPARVRTVRSVGTGAAGIPPELIREVSERFGAPSYRAYGLTECPMVTSGHRDDPEEKRMYTDGRPAGGCTVRVVDADGASLPPGAEGEIEAFGPQLCVGYLDPGLGADAFTSDGFLRTGDLGVIDADGFVCVTGRVKDIIIRKGENLSAKAIEDVLYEHRDVADAAVIGLPDPQSGERVCACVVLREGAAPLEIAALRDFMIERQVMRQKIPEQLEIVEQLPRTPTGKVKKFELRARFTAGG